MNQEQVLEGWLDAFLDYDPQDCSQAWWGFLSFHEVPTAITLSLVSLTQVDKAIRDHEALLQQSYGR